MAATHGDPRRIPKAGWANVARWCVGLSACALAAAGLSWVARRPDPADGGSPHTLREEGASPRYRKIRLNGRMLLDNFAHLDPWEHDEEPEESFVDALTLQLVHQTTDIFIPLRGARAPAGRPAQQR